MERIEGYKIFIGVAAVADYRPVRMAGQKIKKSSGDLDLTLIENPDILAEVAGLDEGPFSVGFAAETEKLEQHATDKLNRKQLDMIIANLVGEKLCFDADDNEVVVLWQGGRQPLPRSSKPELARQLVEVIASRYRQKSTA